MRSARLGLRGTEAPAETGWQILLAKGHLILPVFVLLYLVAVAQLSVTLAALYSIGSVVLVSMLRRATIMTPSKIISALRDGAVGALGIAAACAVVGIMMGVFGVTGLGLKLSGTLIELSGGNVAVLLVMTAVTSLILGIGLPTLPNYIILAVLVAPALTRLGVDPLAAHFFIFYFGNVSSITPPVALNVIITSSIAKSNFWDTCWISMRLALATFLLPFAFVLDTSLLLRGEFTPLSLGIAIALKGAGLVAAALALEGFWRGQVNWYWRVLAGIGGGILIIAPPIIGLAGALLLLPVIWSQWRSRNNYTPITRTSE